MHIFYSNPGCYHTVCRMVKCSNEDPFSMGDWIVTDSEERALLDNENLLTFMDANKCPPKNF